MIDAYLIYYITTVLLIPGIILGIVAQVRVMTTFSRYNQDITRRGTPANEVAKKMLVSAGHGDVKIQRISGELTDNFNPIRNVVSLSDSVYNSASISAVGVAAHEIGHVFQHKENYTPVKLRTHLAKVINALGFLAWPLIFIGLIF